MSDFDPPTEPQAKRPSAAVNARSRSFFSFLPGWFPPLFYLILSVVFLWRSTLAGDVFLPAKLLGHVAPYAAKLGEEGLPPWNPLRWDGIAQFYPWRNFAAQSLHQGIIPLWNPYQFCGTPFVANSQSAVLYPGNLLFYVLPVARAFAWSAVLHLTLCGWFTYFLLRRLRCGEAGALLGGVVFAFSAWQVSWLQLPTFLATSCWFPLLLRQIHVVLSVSSHSLSFPQGQGRENANAALSLRTKAPLLDKERGWGEVASSVAGLGAVVGLMLLAGHLQIAFYGLLAGTLWTVALLLGQWRTIKIGGVAQGLLQCTSGLALGLMLTAPQLLPSLELSRMSHRTGKPTVESYQTYTEYALPPGNLITLALPDFFGNDSDPGNVYWGFYLKKLPDGSFLSIRHNAAETALYIGIIPSLLGLLALLRAVRRLRGAPHSMLGEASATGVLFFGGLAVLAMLMALGTYVNALFYFVVPGFGQTGSPARALVLWALAGGVLSGFGLDALLHHPPTKREVSLVFGVFGVFLVLSLSLVAQALKAPPPGAKIPLLGDVFGRLTWDWLLLAGALVGGGVLLSPLGKTAAPPLPQRGRGGWGVRVPLALVLVTAELFLTGLNANPTAPPDAVYPVTPGLAYLKARVGHERIFPVNQQWSLYNPPPAVLPPNGAMAYGLHDVQGYDSLLTGQYKAFANQFARPNRMGVVDASPPEVGNMIFMQNPNAPLVPLTAARFALTPSATSPHFNPEAVPPGSPVYDAEKEMAIYDLPGFHPRAALLADNAPPAPVTWIEDSATRVTLHVSAPTAATLNLADQFTPGWQATVDGKPVPIARQNDAPIFRAVAIPAGEHTAAFRYAPTSFRLGLYLACFACLLIALLRFPSRTRPAV